MLIQAEPHVDEVIGDHAQSNPSPHAVLTAIATPVQSVPSLENADPAFASGAPALTLFERALFLMSPPLLAPCIPVGYRNIFHTHFLQFFLVGLRVEPGVCRHDPWQQARLLLVYFDCIHQQCGVAGTLIIDFEMRNDLVLGFLHLHQVAELRRLARFSFADNLGLRFEDTHELLIELRVPAKHARPRLFRYLLNSPHHSCQLAAESGELLLLSPPQLIHFAHHTFGLVHNLP